ncbi:MAG: D-inositol-3-phosphate glycosyltransferase, partial [Mycobacteriales bacterium]
ADYAAVLVRLAADPARRARLSAGALRRAAGLSWERTVDDLLDVYDRVATPRRPCELAEAA